MVLELGGGCLTRNWLRNHSSHLFQHSVPRLPSHGISFTDKFAVKQGPDSHFHSVHGYLGVLTSVVLLVQYIFGFLMWGVPGVFGGIDNAKALWKYHRISGYLLFLLILATVISAVWTDFNVNVLNIRAWAVVVSIALIVLGVYPRLHPRKLGFNIGRH